MSTYDGEDRHVAKPGKDQQVIIVGGGFAGVATAKGLAKSGIDVLLIDRNNYHQFQPLLYQVATSQIGVSDVARPLRGIFRGSRHVRVLTEEVTAIDPATRTVTVSGGTEYRGRMLVLAAGAEANFFGTPGAAELAYPLYSLEDAIRLGARLLAGLDATDPDPGAVTEGGGGGVVVVGSGPTGVEMAGAIAESLSAVVPEYFPAEVGRAWQVHLVDMVPTVLAPFSEASQQYARRRLDEIGVHLHLGAGVDEVRKDCVVLSDGTTLPAQIVVWAGGLKARRFAGAEDLPTGRGGRVDVAADLSVPGFPGVYALGDAANIPDGQGGALPQLGSVALQSGRWAAGNIAADLRGEARADFRYRDKGVMAMIGRGAAVAELGPKRRRIHGPVAFLGWLGVHAALLPGAWQRAGAVISWGVSYLTRRRPQIVIGVGTGRIEE